ncbi:polysaccharide pyruvyl transferase family protein [Streptomyces ficellus]|uniref:Polysaccharide pyruvyl transferase family protein n=1 Tax=Streptomyces ficellus TaxID=1977088 RepID=A0ABT7ZA46_9ACTN|nr:polysaccharide pyruvyl transferase family protein [Streptomyces ficellus]MDN3296370.1 polysaccharide pyruvyl transferase family protein [Streptomyces ficellus]
MSRILLTGWFSFLHGEVTAGDELALRRVEDLLDREGLPYDTAWSPGYRPQGLHLEDVSPSRYGALVFICGPLHGPLIEQLHSRFSHCVRIAVGTSVIEPEAPAATGFHHVLARSGGHGPPVLDLAASAATKGLPPVAGVILTQGQKEYGARRRHSVVADAVQDWLSGRDIARIPLETRLAHGDPHHFGTPEQLMAVLSRLDAVITNRLHGLVLALRAGTPVLAVDPVQGGAKVTAQARACQWPAVIPAEAAGPAGFDRWWAWCLEQGRAHAAEHRRRFLEAPDNRLTDPLLGLLKQVGTTGHSGAPV